MPVDSRMVPIPQPLFPGIMVFQRMVESRGNVRAEHAEEVEPDAEYSPEVSTLIAFYEKYRADNNSHQDACGVREGIYSLLGFCVEKSVLFLFPGDAHFFG